MGDVFAGGKIHFETLGCKLNQIESEALARAFSDSGFSVDLESVTASVAENFETILCIINTCTVTSKAEQKARRLIRLLLEKFPQAAIVVTGCYAELEYAAIEAIDSRLAVIRGSRKDILAKLPALFLDFLRKESRNPQDIARFVRALSATKNENQSKIAPQFLLYTDTFQTHSRASIKIQDGCNNACAYCRIHLARGKSVSLDVKSVLERVQQLEKAGQHEVVFTGVNLSQYRGELDGRKADFAELFEILLKNTSHIAFRISSFYPEHITERLCEILKNPRVRPSFHLSIQSGSDKILRSMRRAYVADDVYRAVRLLRQAKENPFIACDIIAGFPDESEEDFAATKKMCEDLRFAWIHAFPFSPRPETPAFSMTPKIPERIKGERVAWLMDCAKRGKIAYIEEMIGKEVDAIVENSRSDRLLLKNATRIHAVTENFLHAEIPVSVSDRVKPGDLIRIKMGKPLAEQIFAGGEQELSAELISVLG